jgi:hypothetical protein
MTSLFQRLREIRQRRRSFPCDYVLMIVSTTISESWFVETVFRCCVTFEYTSRDFSLNTVLMLFQTIIYLNLCRAKMLRNWTGFRPFDEESKSNQVLLDFLAHQVWSELKIITAIISSHEPSLQNNNWTESVQNHSWRSYLISGGSSGG